MKIEGILKLIDCKQVIGRTSDNEDIDFQYGFSSDLMSDVLRLTVENAVLITGLCNTQTIRTADMAEIKLIILGRGKVLDAEMEKLALDSEICVMSSDYSLFRISGELYKHGVLPIY